MTIYQRKLTNIQQNNWPKFFKYQVMKNKNYSRLKQTKETVQQNPMRNSGYSFAVNDIPATSGKI